MFKTNIINCSMLISVVLNLPERSMLEELTVYYERAMTNSVTKLFCKLKGRQKFTEKGLAAMKKTANF